jgi:hypothetical protein
MAIRSNSSIRNIGDAVEVCIFPRARVKGSTGGGRPVFHFLMASRRVCEPLSYVRESEECLCRNPTLKECEDDTHTPEMGTWESSGTSKNSELDYRGKNASPWGVIYTIGKVLKRRCRKWHHMSHLDIYNTSYGQKKGQESNWQFDSRLVKVGNRPNSLACRRRATYRSKALDKRYNFALDLIAIGGLHKTLCAFKVVGVPVVAISGLPLESPGTKNHLDVALVERHKIYYMGEGGGFPRVQTVVSLVSPKSPMARPSTKGAPKRKLINLGLVGCRPE